MKQNIIKASIFVFIFILVLFGLVKFVSPDKSSQITETINTSEIESINGNYSGEIISGLFQGFGQFDFFTGENYSGSWSSGKMQGDGSMLFPDVGSYKGEFDNSMRSGKGEFVWVSGDRYVGSWKNDKMTGSGVYTFANGSSITALFDDNVVVSGQFIYENINYNEATASFKRFKSNVENNEITGTIEFEISTGLNYTGDLPCSEQPGTALMEYPSGNKYDGGIKLFNRSGKGTFTWKTNGVVQAKYVGMWENDLMQGKGVYYYTSSAYPNIEGNFENGMPSGTCVYNKNSIDSYTTEWVKGICTSIKER